MKTSNDIEVANTFFFAGCKLQMDINELVNSENGKSWLGKTKRETNEDLMNLIKRRSEFIESKMAKVKKKEFPKKSNWLVANLKLKIRIISHLIIWLSMHVMRCG